MSSSIKYFSPQIFSEHMLVIVKEKGLVFCGKQISFINDKKQYFKYPENSTRHPRDAFNKSIRFGNVLVVNTITILNVLLLVSNPKVRLSQ